MNAPEPGKMTRLSNPVKPTVHTFPRDESLPVVPPGKMTRIGNPVKPSVLTFGPIPDLMLTVSWHPEADRPQLPRLAAELISAADLIERALGGDGLVFDRSAFREEPTAVTLRLVPRKRDGADERMRAVAERLLDAKRRAREDVVVAQDADLRDQIERTLPAVGRLQLVNGQATEP